MKWVGQHIWDAVSRFRQNVRVENSSLEISKVSGKPTLELSAWSATATAAHAGQIKFLKSGTATIDTYTAGNHTTAGEILGRIEAYGIDDGDGETLSSYIEFANDAISDADSSPGKIIFATSDADDAGTPTVRLTIDDDGLATFVGAVSVGGNLTFDSIALTGIQASGESFADNDVSLMTSAAIDDAIIKGGSTTTIKVLPYHFMQNEEGGVNKSVQFDQSGTIGVKSSSADGELFAFVEIPIGKTATSVTVYGSDTNNVVQVYELDINASVALGGTDGSGNNVTNASGCVVGTACDIVDVASDATNYLVIEVTVTAITDIVYGAAITVSG